MKQKPKKRNRTEYQRNYRKKRYKEDEKFREKHKKTMRNYQRNRYQTDEEYRERKKEQSRKKYKEMKGG